MIVLEMDEVIVVENFFKQFVVTSIATLWCVISAVFCYEPLGLIYEEVKCVP